MNTNVAVIDRPTQQLTVADIRQNVNLIQQVMKGLMKQNTHFGVIPGTDKPTLLQPGADLLCMTFRIRPTFRIDDLSDADAYSFRVTCTGTHQQTGIEIADGMGSASSNEEKYKWRRAVCDEEFNEAPENRRRVKYARAKGGGHYTTKQIRTEPEDGANTVLKMACKRAKIAMVLNATAASDMFTQDYAEMPGDVDEETGEVSGKRSVEQPKARQATKSTPASAAPASGPETDAGADTTPASDGQLKLIRSKQESGAITDVEVFKKFGIEKLEGITVDTGNKILAWLRDPAA